MFILDCPNRSISCALRREQTCYNPTDLQYSIVNDSSTATNIATFDGYKEHGAGIGLNVLLQSSLPSGDGTYKGTGINDWEGMYIPKVTIATSSVPEPTTATLSLLALAGLAARRRRK